MKPNYHKNIVSQTDSQLSSVLVSNRSMTENSLRMRAMAYLAQVKANLLTETILELNEDKKIVKEYANSLKDKNTLLEKQKIIIEEQNKKLLEQIELEKRHEIVKKQAEELEKVNKELNDSQSLANIGNWSFNYLKKALLSSSNEIHNILEIKKNIKYLLYKDIMDVSHPDDINHINNSIQNSIENKTAYEFENRLLMPNGQIKLVRQKGFHLYDDEKKILLTHGIIQDITEYKRLEEERLEKERQSISQTKLEAMGEMIGNIAHQWRQPLNAITVATSGMQLKYDLNELSDKEFEMFSEGIIENAEFLSKTIDTFTNFIREEKKYKELILQEELDQALSICNNIFRINFIELENKIDYSNPIKIRMLTGELSEVIINLLNNSKDIFRQRDVKNPLIKISLCVEDEKVIIYIEDNAGGIKDEIMPHIFEPYFTTKHQFKGTGIGLYMCHKIITESLYGSIYVSNTGVGAKFSIELPLNS